MSTLKRSVSKESSASTASNRADTLAREISDLQHQVRTASSEEERSRIQIRLHQKENALKALDPDSSSRGRSTDSNGSSGRSRTPKKDKDAAPSKKSPKSPGAKKRSKTPSKSGDKNASNTGTIKRAPDGGFSEDYDDEDIDAQIQALEDTTLSSDDPELLKLTLRSTESQLVETLSLVETLQKTVYESEARRKLAEQQALELKNELVTLTGALKEQMNSGRSELLDQIEKLQTSVLEYQSKYDELKKKKRDNVFEERSVDDLKQRVADLQSCVQQMDVENQRLKKEKQPDLSEYTKKIEKLQESILEYQEKCEDLKRKNLEMQKAKPKRDPNTNRLNEEIQNLTFQLYYGQTSKDVEIEQLKAKVEQLEAENAALSKLKKKYGKLKDKQISEWLLSGDVTDAL